MKPLETLLGLIRIPLDFCLVLAGFYLGYQIRQNPDFINRYNLPLNPSDWITPSELLSDSLIFASILTASFILFGLYSFKKQKRLNQELKKSFSTSLLWVLFIMAYFFIQREVFFSRLTLALGTGLSIIFILSLRVFLHGLKFELQKKGYARQVILLIGANKITEQLAKKMQNDPHYEVLGFISKNFKKIPKLKRLGSLSDLAKIVDKYKVQQVIQTSQRLTELQDHDILEFCQEKHLDYHFVPDILAVERSNIEIEALAGFPLIHLKPTSLDGWGKILKRVMDILISFIALISLTPLFLIIAIAIKIDSKGPVIFSKLKDGTPCYRVGQKGKLIRFYKFRSMQNNTHHLRYGKLAEKNHREGPLMKIKNDPRITRVGKFLRKTSFDELPQLWNVLIGSMSLVGPRPHLPEEVALYEKHHKFLLTIKPGITGLSQTSGRSDLNFEEEVRLDSYYIKHWSPFFDLKLMFKTLLVPFDHKAAD
jgi:exopolysaccharide biosynthesis polyprenyl glycosylphosphotransferase